MELPRKIKQIYLKIIDWFLVEPKRLVRLVVLSICSIVVFFQMWECASKLLHPPVSTHSHFDLNKTMYYPAVTFCREPAFKIDVMTVKHLTCGEIGNKQSHFELFLQSYNLSFHPSITSSWKDFPFDTSSVSQLYDEATYTRDEFFNIFALDGEQNNIEVEASIHFSLGRCFTLKPKKSTTFPVRRS
jgi:Amiloride-sensitive sodium channel